MGAMVTTTSFSALIPGMDFSLTAVLSLTAKSIEQNEAYLKGRLSERYDVVGWTAASASPALVIAMGERLTEADIYDRGFGGVPIDREYAKGQREWVEAMLKMIIEDETMNLIDSSGAVIGDGSNTVQARSSTEDYNTTFDEDDPLNWAPNSEKLSDIGNNRS